MKYIKGALIVDDREVMVELPTEWRTFLETKKFLPCRSYLGEDTVFNTSMIFNVREVSEEVWRNWMTRIEMAKEKIQEEALKKVSESKE